MVFLKKLMVLLNGYPYDKKMPLTEELKYFLEKLNNDKGFKISNIDHGLEVIKILVKANQQLNGS